VRAHYISDRVATRTNTAEAIDDAGAAPLDEHVTEFDSLVSEYLNTLGGKSPRTYTTYRTGLRRFRSYLEARGPLERWTPAKIGPTLLEEFYAWLVRQHGRERRATVATHSAAVRAFVRFLARRGLLASGVTYEQMRENVREVMGRSTYKSPRIDRRLPIVVTHAMDAEVPSDAERGGVKRLEVLRDKALLMVLFCSGMRRAEVARLDRVDVEDGWADRALITGKGDKERWVFFDAETQEAVRAYLEARNDSLTPLFLRHDNHRGKAAGHGGERWRLSPQSVWGIVKRYAKEVGVPATTHHFRHSKASVLLNRGASLSEVQDILGHASPDTTKRIYAHYQTQHLRDAFDRYSASAEELVGELQAGQRRQPPTKAPEEDV
jgi:integrase/recombinase XerC